MRPLFAADPPPAPLTLAEALELFRAKSPTLAAARAHYEAIAEATGEIARPVIFSVLIIVVALIPLFTMSGVPGKIFGPMSVAYGFALLGAQIFAFVFAPVLSSWGNPNPEHKRTRVVRGLHRQYTRVLEFVIARPRSIVVGCAALLVLTVALTPLIGGEFMPKLEEGNLWVRVTLPQDVSFETSSVLADRIRADLRQFAPVTHVVSQLGRPDDGTVQNGAFMIYRENDRRYIPIKFSVRGRDLSSTMEEVQDRLAREIQLPKGYHYEWAGEYDSLKKEQRRLMIVLPITLAVIFLFLYLAFDSVADALTIVAMLPVAITGGALSLLITRTPFSISAAVGFASAIGVATLGGLVLLSAIRRFQHSGLEPTHAIRDGSMIEMRPVLMACLAAALGLLPASISHGIGAQAQQPLARVVVGSMVTTIAAVTVLVPALMSLRMKRPKN